MADDNVIQEMSVRLVGDTSKLIQQVEDAADVIEKRLEEVSDVEVTGKIDPRLLDYAQKVVDSAEATGRTIREVAETWERLNMAGGFTADILTRAAERAKALREEISQAASEQLRQAAQQAGVPLMPGAGEMWKENAKGIADAKDELEDLNKVLKENIADIVQASKHYNDMEEAVNRVKDAWQAAGKEFPVDLEKRMRQQMQGVLAAGMEVGATPERTQASLDRVTDSYARMATQQQRSGGLMGILQRGAGSLINRLFGLYAVYRLVSKAIQEINRAIQRQIALQREQVQFTNQVREYNRANADVQLSVRGLATDIQGLSEQYDQSEQAVLAGASALLQSTRDVGLTREQIVQLTEASVVFADLWNTEIPQAAMAIGQAFQGNYQALAQFGVTLDDERVRVEAIRRGFLDLGEDMTPSIQRMTILAVIGEQAAEANRDLADAQQSLSERTEATTKAFSDQWDMIARYLAPIWIRLQEIGGFLARVFGGAVRAGFQVMFILFVRFTDVLGRALSLVVTLAEAIREGPGSGTDWGARFREHVAQWQEETHAAFQQVFDDMDAFGNEADQINQNAGEIGDAMIGMADDAERAAILLADALARVRKDFDDSLAELDTDLADRLAEIERDAAQERQRRNEDFRVGEIRAQEDFHREMVRMEQQYLMDLEDAVRERDARAVIQLMRRHNLEKGQRTDDFELQRKRRQEDFQRQMQDLERQTAERRRQAQESYNDRLRDLQRALQRELDAIYAAAKQRLALEAGELKGVYNLLKSAYGPGGWYEALYTRAAAIKAAFSGLQAKGAAPAGLKTSRQGGGSFIATGPMTMTVGEGVPERVEVTPLSLATGAPRAGFGGANRQRAQIDMRIRADDRFIVETADRVMNEVAEVFISVAPEQVR